jgi:hypothetical protein
MSTSKEGPHQVITQTLWISKVPFLDFFLGNIRNYGKKRGVSLCR